MGVLIWLGVQDIFHENALKGIELLISYFVVSAQSFWTFLFNKLSKTKTKLNWLASKNFINLITSYFFPARFSLSDSSQL